jgi:hypothetical protein
VRVNDLDARFRARLCLPAPPAPPPLQAPPPAAALPWEEGEGELEGGAEGGGSRGAAYDSEVGGGGAADRLPAWVGAPWAPGRLEAAAETAAADATAADAADVAAAAAAAEAAVASAEIGRLPSAGDGAAGECGGGGGANAGGGGEPGPGPAQTPATGPGAAGATGGEAGADAGTGDGEPGWGGWDDEDGSVEGAGPGPQEGGEGTRKDAGDVRVSLGEWPAPDVARRPEEVLFDEKEIAFGPEFDMSRVRLTRMDADGRL